MPVVEHRFAQVNGLRLHRLELAGSGRPTLLAHGVGGTAGIRHHAAPAPTAAARPAAVELRGFGLSQGSRDEACSTGEPAGDLHR